MPSELTTIEMPPDPHPKLARFRAKLGRSNLLEVLDSFPPAVGFQYFHTTFKKKPAIKICLGRRRLNNNEFATSWAFLELEKSDAPTVHFQDEEHQPPGNSSRYHPRGPSSLVRKAQDLLPPFRFMQYDADDEVKNVRGMLLALVLYYALVRGVSEAALEWKYFHNSLTQALEYIEKEAAYHVWRDDVIAEPASSRERTIRTTPSPAAPTTAITRDRSPRTDLHGGVVSSRGSSISPPVGSGLAAFMKVLGKDVPLLDYIPSTSVTIERQALDPDQFSFRLLFGKCDGEDVHVYPNLPGGRVTKIMSHSQQQERIWSYYKLEGVDLLEPFAWLVRMLPDSNARHDKMRFLVAYYFWLAEAEGLIDTPLFNFAPVSMRASFIALCKIFRRAELSQDDLSNQPGNKSLVVRLRPAPEVLSILDEATGSEALSEEQHSPDDTARHISQSADRMVRLSEQLESQPLRTSLPLDHLTIQLNDEPAMSGTLSTRLTDTNIQSELPDNDDRVDDRNTNVEASPQPEATKTPQSLRALSGDSGFNSKYTTPASTVDGMNVTVQNRYVDSPVDNESENVQAMSSDAPPADELASGGMDLDDAPVPSIEELEERRNLSQEADPYATEPKDPYGEAEPILDAQAYTPEVAQDEMEHDDVAVPSIEEADEHQFPTHEINSAVVEQSFTQNVLSEVRQDQNRMELQNPDALVHSHGPSLRIDGSDVASPPSEMGLGLVEDTPEREGLRLPSVFSMSSDDKIEPARPNRPAPQLTLQDESPCRNNRSRNIGNIIDFTKSDDEDLYLGSRSQRQSATEQRNSSRTRWRQTINISDDDDDNTNARSAGRQQNAPERLDSSRARALPSSRTHWRQTINISDDDEKDEAENEDDDFMPDLDGDTWRRASLRQ